MKEMIYFVYNYIQQKERLDKEEDKQEAASPATCSSVTLVSKNVSWKQGSCSSPASHSASPALTRAAMSRAVSARGEADTRRQQSSAGAHKYLNTAARMARYKLL